MELSTSDILPLAAIFIAGLSAYYTRGQRNLAQASNDTNYRAQLAERHEKYRIALKSVNDSHKEELSVLSNLATKTLRKVIDIFDEFDINEPHPRYLRHILHECSAMVYYAFKGQLGWQSGLNIAQRMYQFTQAEHDLEPCRCYFEGDCLRETFAQGYFRNRNAYLENLLFKDEHFCGLIKELERRLVPSDGPELLRRVLSEIEEFVVLLKRAQPGFEKSAKYIDEIIKESESEHFKLRESPSLFSRLMYRKSTLETMSCLLIPSIGKEDVVKYRSFVSFNVYVCAILHAVEGLHSWGWTEYLSAQGSPPGQQRRN